MRSCGARLANRLERTAMPEPDEDEERPGRDASFAAVIASFYALAAQVHAEHGDVPGARETLGGAEEAMVDVLRSRHALAVAIGDAQGNVGE
ncbi:hypothetical protein ACIPQJ_02605 [Streptomyces sp. NPDC090082]|uniref:hypothetical protein n=1 Tax=unclassified Streptomyces TaxID=2593676 RepID=UPI0038008E24